MNRVKNATRNIIWGIVNKVVILMLPFITRTLFIYTLGTLYLGLNGLFTSILQVLNISELGINSAITFSMYKPLAEGNTKQVNELLSFYRLCYRIVGFVILGIGLCLIPFLPNLISGKIPSDINIYILYLIYILGTFFTYELFAYRMALLTAIQRNDIISKIGMFWSFIQFLLQVIILFYFKNYYLYVIISNLTPIFNNLTCAYICKRKYKNYKPIGNINKETLCEIRKKVQGMIFQKIGGVVLTSVDSIVISSFLGLQTLAMYQNYYFVITSLFSILAVIMSSITAIVGNSIVLESKKKNYLDFTKFNFLYVWISGWFSVCILCMYQTFIELWVGEELLFPYYMVVLFSLYFFIHKWCDMLYIYQDACGIWWESRWVPIIATIINLILNITLVNIIGLAGILISTIISVAFIYDIGYAKVLFNVYFEKELLYKFLYKQLFYLLSICISALITILVCSGLNLSNLWIKFILNGLVCTLLPNSILILLWRKLPEFSISKQFVLEIFKKKLGLSNKIWR